MPQIHAPCYEESLLTLPSPYRPTNALESREGRVECRVGGARAGIEARETAMQAC